MALSTAGLPKLDSPWLVRSVAGQLATAFSGVADRASTVKSTWAPIGVSYDAPEANLVLTAMDTPDIEATELEGKGETVQTALEAYADRLEELQTRKTTLIADIDAFHEKQAEVDAENEDNNPLETGWDWVSGEDSDLMNEEEDLSNRAAALQADKDAAERDCANTIGAIWGAPTYEAAGETAVWDETVYGTTAEGYEELVRSGDAPWGHPSMWSEGDWTTKVEQVFDGAGRSITGTVGFFGDLVGFGGAGQAEAAWSGLGQLGFDVVRGGGGLVGTVWSQFDPEGVAESQDRLLETGKGIIGWDSWDTSGWQTGGSLGFDVALSVATLGAGAAAKGGIRAAISGAKAGARSIPGSTTSATLSAALRNGFRGGVDGAVRGLNNWIEQSRTSLRNLLPPGRPDTTPQDRSPEGGAGTVDGGGEGTPDRVPQGDGNGTNLSPELLPEDRRSGYGLDADGNPVQYTDRRPSYGSGQVDEVYNRYADEDGDVVLQDREGDYYPIHWEPGDDRRGVWDMGHHSGQEYWRMHERYLAGPGNETPDGQPGVTRQEFLDWYRDADNYRPEDPGRNRSHMDEQPR